MKTKNLIVAAFVAVFAFGSAFVSVTFDGPNDQHINDAGLARDIVDVDCKEGQIPCMVQVDGAANNPNQVYTNQTLQTQVLGGEASAIPTVFQE